MFQQDLFKNKTVLDMGCGTAVLAIYAEMKNANHILAIDNDNWAYENSVENCEWSDIARWGFGFTRTIKKL